MRHPSRPSSQFPSCGHHRTLLVAALACYYACIVFCFTRHGADVPDEWWQGPEVGYQRALSSSTETDRRKMKEGSIGSESSSSSSRREGEASAYRRRAASTHYSAHHFHHEGNSSEHLQNDHNYCSSALQYGHPPWEWQATHRLRPPLHAAIFWALHSLIDTTANIAIQIATMVVAPTTTTATSTSNSIDTYSSSFPSHSVVNSTSSCDPNCMMVTITAIIHSVARGLHAHGPHLVGILTAAMAHYYASRAAAALFILARIGHSTTTTTFYVRSSPNNTLSGKRSRMAAAPTTTTRRNGQKEEERVIITPGKEGTNKASGPPPSPPLRRFMALFHVTLGTSFMFLYMTPRPLSNSAEVAAAAGALCAYAEWLLRLDAKRMNNSEGTEDGITAAANCCTENKNEIKRESEGGRTEKQKQEEGETTQKQQHQQQEEETAAVTQQSWRCLLRWAAVGCLLRPTAAITVFPILALFVWDSSSSSSTKLVVRMKSSSCSSSDCSGSRSVGAGSMPAAAAVFSSSALPKLVAVSFARRLQYCLSVLLRPLLSTAVTALLLSLVIDLWWWGGAGTRTGAAENASVFSSSRSSPVFISTAAFNTTSIAAAISSLFSSCYSLSLLLLSSASSSLLNFYRFNVRTGGSSLFGAHPWHWYFSLAVPAGGGAHGIAALAWIAQRLWRLWSTRVRSTSSISVSRVKSAASSSSSSHVISSQASSQPPLLGGVRFVWWRLLVAALLPLVLLSAAAAHKELRFAAPSVMVPTAILAALAYYDFFINNDDEFEDDDESSYDKDRDTKRDHKKKSREEQKSEKKEHKHEQHTHSSRNPCRSPAKRSGGVVLWQWQWWLWFLSAALVNITLVAVFTLGFKSGPPAVAALLRARYPPLQYLSNHNRSNSRRLLVLAPCHTLPGPSAYHRTFATIAPGTRTHGGQHPGQHNKDRFGGHDSNDVFGIGGTSVISCATMRLLPVGPSTLPTPGADDADRDSSGTYSTDGDGEGGEHRAKATPQAEAVSEKAVALHRAETEDARFRRDPKQYALCALHLLHYHHRCLSDDHKSRDSDDCNANSTRVSPHVLYDCCANVLDLDCKEEVEEPGEAAVGGGDDGRSGGGGRQKQTTESTSDIIRKREGVITGHGGGDGGGSGIGGEKNVVGLCRSLFFISTDTNTTQYQEKGIHCRGNQRRKRIFDDDPTSIRHAVQRHLQAVGRQQQQEQQLTVRGHSQSTPPPPDGVALPPTADAPAPAAKTTVPVGIVPTVLVFYDMLLFSEHQQEEYEDEEGESSKHSPLFVEQWLLRYGYRRVATVPHAPVLDTLDTMIHYIMDRVLDWWCGWWSWRQDITCTIATTVTVTVTATATGASTVAKIGSPSTTTGSTTMTSKESSQQTSSRVAGGTRSVSGSKYGHCSHHRLRLTPLHVDDGASRNIEVWERHTF